jgi:hypothetical protein
MKFFYKVYKKIKNLFYNLKIKRNILSNSDFTSSPKNIYPLSGIVNYDFNYKPKTSIIFCHFTSEKTLLNSLKNLKPLREQIEIIIMNDKGKLSSRLNKCLVNSNDLIINTKDLGEGIAYINGANISRSSDYLIFCQDDDLIPYDNKWYEDCLNEFQNDKMLGLIGLNGGGFYEGDKQIDFSKINKSYMKRYCSWLKFGPFIIKRKLYFDIGGFELFGNVGESANAVDRHLTLKVIKHGYKAMLLVNDNTEKWKRRENRDDGLDKHDLKLLKNRNLSFSDSEIKFLKKHKKEISDIQKKFNYK